jgi:hypothetical protein
MEDRLILRGITRLVIRDSAEIGSAAATGSATATATGSGEAAGTP